MSKKTYAPETTLAADADKLVTLVSAAKGDGSMLDSASAAGKDAVVLALADAKNLLPARMNSLLDKIEDERVRTVAVCSLLDGVRTFEHEHGFIPTADLVDSVLAQAVAVADGKAIGVLPSGMTLDSVSSSTGSTELSHQPNRLALAILGGLAEACPFGAYTPSDLSSGESKLAIINSSAGSNFGGYGENDILDGINGGSPYLLPERELVAVVNADRTGAVAAFKARTNGSGQELPLLRHHTQVVMNGFVVAKEIDQNSKGAKAQIAGHIELGGTGYSINGSVTVATGVVELTFSPALPAEHPQVRVVGYINYESNPDLTPRINTQAESFSLYTKAARAIMQVTPDARTQAQSELGADFLTVAVSAARRQLAQERYFTALRKVRAVALNTLRVFNFDAATQLIEKTRAQRWRDFGSFVALVDQIVANQTMEHGVGLIYCGAQGAAQFLSMGADDFQPSGVTARAGIYRLGRYKRRYDVYYTPKEVQEAEDGTEIELLLISQAAQVARNPIVFSDAVPPTLIPLSVGTDLKNGAALFTRQLTEVNPHVPSAMGCALIKVKNLDAVSQ